MISNNRKCTTEEFILKSKKIFGDLYNYSKVQYINNKVKVELICKAHGSFLVRPDTHLTRKCGCKKCSNIAKGIKNRNKNWLNDFKFIHGDRYDYSKVRYKDNKTKVEIICKDHGSFFMKPNSHISQKQGCYKCSRKYNNTESFIEASNLIFNNLYDYTRVIYIDSHKKVEIVCKDHGSFFIRPCDHINQKSGCSKCGKISMASKYRKDIDTVISQFKKLNGDLYDYSKVKYFNNNKKVTIVCKIHGDFYQTPKCHLGGDGCPKCSLSKGERKIMAYLDKLGIDNLNDFIFNDCRYKNPLKFDFYLPEYNLCIEYDGEQHSSPIGFFGGEIAYVNQLTRDKIKNEYCLKKNINLIRINYDQFENIENIIDHIIKK